MTETVWVVSNAHSRSQAGTYHTDRDCQFLKDGNTHGEIVEKSREFAEQEMGLEHCPGDSCGDSMDRESCGNYGTSVAEQLRNSDVDIL